jgi:hypothetical protein
VSQDVDAIASLGNETRSGMKHYSVSRYKLSLLCTIVLLMFVLVSQQRFSLESNVTTSYSCEHRVNQ